jgi:hypothetical protein
VVWVACWRGWWCVQRLCLCFSKSFPPPLQQGRRYIYRGRIGQVTPGAWKVGAAAVLLRRDPRWEEAVDSSARRRHMHVQNSSVPPYPLALHINVLKKLDVVAQLEKDLSPLHSTWPLAQKFSYSSSCRHIRRYVRSCIWLLAACTGCKLVGIPSRAIVKWVGLKSLALGYFKGLCACKPCFTSPYVFLAH